jgi:excisionase family DNA binding protein
MSIRDFCERYNVGRTTVHQEIKEGRLQARKAGRRTLIGSDDAETWWLALPTLDVAASVAASTPQTTRRACRSRSTSRVLSKPNCGADS